MVWSCMQLKGTMIVPLILVETVEEQNNKGELTCEKKLTAAAEWAEEAAYHSHRGRNLEYLSCSLLAVAADLLILGPIFNQISSFVLFLLCVGVCTCCAEFYYYFYPPLAIQVWFSGHLHQHSCPRLWASDKKDIILLSTLSVGGFEDEAHMSVCVCRVYSQPKKYTALL